MRALVAHGPGDFEIVDVPDPRAPAPGERLISVEAAGVCAADRLLWQGDGPREPAWPLLPGHELLGRDVTTGERLTAEVKIPCGECELCLSDRGNICTQGIHMGTGFPGAFAEQILLPPGARVHPIPEDLPVEAAVLAEPMACALHAVRRVGVRPGDVVAVIGLGSIGALAVHAAKMLGASSVVGVVRSAEKARMARELGADRVLDARTDCKVSTGVNVVIECSGDVAAAAAALHLVEPGGRIGLYGTYATLARFDLNQIAEFKELTIYGGHLAPGCFPEAITLLQSVDGGRIVTGVHRLEDFRGALEPSVQPRLKEILVP